MDPYAFAHTQIHICKTNMHLCTLYLLQYVFSCRNAHIDLNVRTDMYREGGENLNTFFTKSNEGPAASQSPWRIATGVSLHPSWWCLLCSDSCQYPISVLFSIDLLRLLAWCSAPTIYEDCGETRSRHSAFLFPAQHVDGTTLRQTACAS